MQNDELKRFFDSINFSSEDFLEAKIEKVVYFSSQDEYEVIISSKKMIPKKEMDLLFKACLNKIKGQKKCHVKIIYSDIIGEDALKYSLDIFNDFYQNRPSMKKLNVTLDNNKLIINVTSKIEEDFINSDVSSLNMELQKYGITEYSFEPRINEEEAKIVKEEIAKEKETDIKKEESPIVFGFHRDGDVTKLSDIYGETENAIFECYIFSIDSSERKGKKGIVYVNNLEVSDKTDSYLMKIVRFNADENNAIMSKLKIGMWIRIFGNIEMDDFMHSFVLNPKSIEIIPSKEVKIVDNAEVKRVELHAHTMMSQMDGLTKIDLGKHTCELVSRAIDMGYRGVAITDHNGCQAFPIAYQIIKGYNKKVEDPSKKFKGLYGTELTLVDDTIRIVVRPSDTLLEGTTYVVFDTETTGFNATDGDQMIEIGAVKLKDGVIIDRFDEFINPNRHIPDKITALTEITDDMVKDADDEGTVTKRFLDWAGDSPMVAHNAKFDISFIESAMRKYNLGTFKNTVIDTLELSRAMEPGFARHSLSALVKRYNVPFDEESHHRADYDAEGTGLVFAKMLKNLIGQNYQKINELDQLISKKEIHKFGRTYHFNAIAINRDGLKNLFKIISLANTVYLFKTPRILRSELEKLREGLLIGSGCYESEVFVEAKSKDDDDMLNIINFYDYVEVQPPEVYDHLIQTSDFANVYEVQRHIEKIIRLTKAAGKIIVATGDVHHFTREDKIYREIIVNQKVPGGGRHPLAKKDIKSIPSQHFRTTEEMLNDFSFLDKDLAYEIVVTNTNKVLDMVEDIEVIIDTHGVPFSPRVRSDDGKSYLDCPAVVTELVFNKAEELYGNPLPHNIEERISKELYGDAVFNYWHDKLSKENPDYDAQKLEEETFKYLHETLTSGFDKVKEIISIYVRDNWTEEDGEMNDDTVSKKVKKTLGGIIGGGFDPIYLIAQRLVKHSNDDGFLVGSRGSVGSSFVATLMGITEVNPLPAHYRCPKCKLSIFKDENGNELGGDYPSGFDLPDKMCPNCNIPMYKDGQDMPFATFLGFNADKVPDIDLNFSDLNQADAHEYTKVLFGVDNVYRAGTIGTVADKTAYGFVKGYFEDKGIMNKQSAEIKRLAIGCTGVKRTTGQHPGGIVVVPDYMDVSDVTPYQFPAEDPTSPWRTTHFDYHSIEENLLKLDILGHSDPTQLRLIQDLSKTNVLDVPMDDKDTMSIFTSTDVLGVTNEQIMCPTGTLGIPEFGTPFTIGMVNDTKPTTFAELVKISGLSHGTDVWLGNAQELIKNNIVPFKEVIGCRDDIMVYLIYHGVKPIKAFKIMEFVRKGKASKDPEGWKEHRQTMEDAGIESWYIDSCEKIKYMFPKAHATAYVMSAFRIAWYKVHMPAYFYASWFSTKATAFDIEAMINGYDAIKEKIIEIRNKGNEASNKEEGTLESLNVALEMAARNIKVAPFDLYQSKGLTFGVKDDGTIIPAFITIDGLGEVVAMNIEKEAQKHPFISIEDFQNRCKVSQTIIDKMRSMGIFRGMPETSQLSLF